MARESIINIVLIGQGEWGKNYIKTLSLFEDVNLTVANRNNWKELINNKPDRVIVATPPDSHIEIASAAMIHGIPTMIEKPLALSLQQALELKKFNAPVLVNYINLFCQSYEDLNKIVAFKDIKHISTNGFGNGPLRNYSGLWDYGPHCLSMILYLTKMLPHTVFVSTLSSKLYNIDMDFGEFKANSIIGNGGSYKSRSIQVDFDGMTISYNDVNRPDNHKQPLQNVLEKFINGNFDDDRFGLDLSFKVLKLLECCELSLKNSAMIYCS